MGLHAQFLRGFDKLVENPVGLWAKMVEMNEPPCPGGGLAYKVPESSDIRSLQGGHTERVDSEPIFFSGGSPGLRGDPCGQPGVEAQIPPDLAVKSPEGRGVDCLSHQPVSEDGDQLAVCETY